MHDSSSSTLSAWFANTLLPFLFTSSWPASRSIVPSEKDFLEDFFDKVFFKPGLPKPLPVVGASEQVACAVLTVFCLSAPLPNSPSTTLKRRPQLILAFKVEVNWGERKADLFYLAKLGIIICFLVCCFCMILVHTSPPDKVLRRECFIFGFFPLCLIV